MKFCNCTAACRKCGQCCAVGCDCYKSTGTVVITTNTTSLTLNGQRVK